jgi:hypothetical protein
MIPLRCKTMQNGNWVLRDCVSENSDAYPDWPLQTAHGRFIKWLRKLYFDYIVLSIASCPRAALVQIVVKAITIASFRLLSCICSPFLGREKLS